MDTAEILRRGAEANQALGLSIDWVAALQQLLLAATQALLVFLEGLLPAGELPPRSKAGAPLTCSPQCVCMVDNTICDMANTLAALCCLRCQLVPAMPSGSPPRSP